MPPKKARGKKAGAEKAKKSRSTVVVGREFYESQITELNHVLSDLRTKQVEIEQRNEDLLADKERLIQDEADIVSYLNRTIQERSDEIVDLQNKCDTVEEERVKAAQDFEAEKEKMQENYMLIEENLLADMKLTVGKIHALEEFRLLRDELMQKYEELEHDTEEQKVRHKQEIYEVERKFIIGEDKLKKEMDAKLKSLIEKFQAVTDLRVAATTLRVLKENIALNNMIEYKLRSLRKLYAVHDKLEGTDGRLEIMSQLSIFESNAMSTQTSALRMEILGLVNEYHDMATKVKAAKQLEPTIIAYQKKAQELNDKITQYEERKNLLELNLHEIRCQREDIKAKIRHEHGRNEELKGMLVQVRERLESPTTNDEVYSICEQALEEQPETHSKSTALYEIFEFLRQVREWHRYPKPMEILESRSDIYMQGKVGLVPREVILKSMIPTMVEKAEQLDGSIDLIPFEKTWVCPEEEIETDNESVSLAAEDSVVVLIEQESQTDDDVTTKDSILT